MSDNGYSLKDIVFSKDGRKLKVYIKLGEGREELCVSIDGIKQRDKQKRNGKRGI